MNNKVDKRQLDRLGGKFTKLARVMSDRDVTIKLVGKACCTDGNTVYLPANSDVLDVDPHVLEGMADHEIWHVREEVRHEEAGKTTMVQLSKRGTKPERMMLQVYEDVRIEIAASREYVGIEENLIALNRHCIDKRQRALQEGKAKENFWYDLGCAIIAKARGFDYSQASEGILKVLGRLDEEIADARDTKWSQDSRELAIRTVRKVQDLKDEVEQEQERRQKEKEEQEKEQKEKEDQEKQDQEEQDQEDQEKQTSQDQTQEQDEDGNEADEDDAGDQDQGEPVSDLGNDDEDAESNSNEQDESDDSESSEQEQDQEEQDALEQDENGDETDGDGTDGQEQDGPVPDFGDDEEDIENGSNEQNGDEEKDEQDDEDGDEEEDGLGDEEDDEDDNSDEQDGEDDFENGKQDGEQDGEASPGDSEDSDSGDGTPGAEDNSNMENKSEGEDNQEQTGEDTSDSDATDTDVPSDLDDMDGDELDEVAKDLEDTEQEPDSDDIMDEVRKEIEEAAVEDVENNDRYTVSPKALARDRWVTPASGDDKEYKRLKQVVNSQIHTLKSKLYQLLKARVQARHVGDQESGMLDSAALYSLRAGNKNVFSHKVQGEEIDTCVSVLVDLSGSMGISSSKMCCAFYARHTAIALAETLAGLNIPFEIVGFNNPVTGRSYRSDDYSYTRIRSFRFTVFKAYNEKHNASTRSRLVQISGSGTNADGEAVMEMAKRLVVRTEKRKILLVLSDGRPTAVTDRSVGQQHLRDVISKISKAGIEIYGIGMKSACVEEYYNEQNGSDCVVVRDDISTLAVEVMRLLKDKLTGQRRRKKACTM